MITKSAAIVVAFTAFASLRAESDQHRDWEIKTDHQYQYSVKNAYCGNIVFVDVLCLIGTPTRHLSGCISFCTLNSHVWPQYH